MHALRGSAGTLTTEQYTPGLWGSPEEALQNFDEAAKEKSSPISRITEAFSALKDMHKGPAQTEAAFKAAAPNSPSPLDTAQWPFGPVGAPSSALPSPLDTAKWPYGPIGAPSSARAYAPPSPRPRPSEAPAPTSELSFFQRSTALQRDPITGEYLDPEAASKAGPGIFKGLFG